jgi:hypothetical protein
MNIIKFEEVEAKIITIRDTPVILDSDVAALYGVDTKRINEAVSNNPDKFPEGYVFELEKIEWESLKSKISTLKNLGRGQHKKFLPKAFTEKGLYMLATILKSSQATATTIMIIETFSKMRELGRNIKELSTIQKDEEKYPIMRKSGELIAEIFDEDLTTDGTETTIELNFAVLKLKHTIKKTKK